MAPARSVGWAPVLASDVSSGASKAVGRAVPPKELEVWDGLGSSFGFGAVWLESMSE